MLPFLPFFLLLSYTPPAQDPNWVVLEAREAISQGGAEIRRLADGVLELAGTNPPVDTYVLDFPWEGPAISALRLEVLPAEERQAGRSKNGNFVLSELQLEIGTGLKGRFERVDFGFPSASWYQSRWPVAAAVDGDPQTGWGVGSKTKQSHVAVFPLQESYSGKGGRHLRVQMEFHYGHQHQLARFRLAATSVSPPPLAGMVEKDWREMEARIPKAIRRGAEYLISQQELDGSWNGHQDAYPAGQTALSLYTLLKSQVPHNHHAVQRALEYLRTHPPRKTYSMGCALMALEAFHRPEFLPWMVSLTETLIGWQKNGGFGYPEGGGDLSNTQYGALGLRAAAKAGVEIPVQVWIDLAERTCLHQTKVEHAYQPKGFGYGFKSKATGSMTSAGVSILAICIEQLRLAGEPYAEYEAVMQDGLKWLAVHFDARANPKGPNPDQWTYYYLYGLERVGGLLSRHMVGGSDWYREGTSFILSSQSAKGSWATAYGFGPMNTCFALLFLNRATAPATGDLPPLPDKSYATEDPEEDVQLRISGDTPLTFWLAGFGRQALAQFSWVDEEEGLRVQKVEYLRPGKNWLAEGNRSPGSWRISEKNPGDGWQQPQFRERRWNTAAGAFGTSGSPGAVVRTPWLSEDLWLRRTLVFEKDSWVDPQLEVYYSPDAVGPSDQQHGPDLVQLFEEQPGFSALLNQGNGRVELVLDQNQAYRGRRSLRANPEQRHRVRMPKWGFPIKAKPGPGEYRYLRFAWRKEGGTAVQLQLANGGSWKKALRYHAGQSQKTFQPSVSVNRRMPKGWTVVTRDLYKDFGEDWILTGLSLTPLDGELAWFDHFYLARSKADFDDIPSQRVLLSGQIAAVQAKASEVATPPLQMEVFCNGQRVFAGEVEPMEYEPVVWAEDLLPHLVEGENTLAVHLKCASPNRAVDFRLSDWDLLAAVPGDPGQSSLGQRFPAQATLPRPGTYPIHARVHALVPEDLAEEDGEVVVLESSPLAVKVDQATDEALLSYAGDASRNLILEAKPTVTASSFLADGSWQASRCADGRLATGWLSADGDRRPWLKVDLGRTVRANRILLSHAPSTRRDSQRTAKIRYLSLVLNGKGKPIRIEMDADPNRKTVWLLEKPAQIRSLTLQVEEIGEVKGQKSAVGLAEVELQLQR
ncbi:MAG: hypothetical protein DWQ01_02065 [Planctomycetota bacterium]|nr:MAG: hypothetical protein DWQ01_02065 [Planctomycetota bacterium]